MIEYARAFPAELDAAWARGAPAVWPMGALEWHGDHLPLGTDGLLAEPFARRLAERLNGVLLPTLWTPITTLPHRHSLRVRPEAFAAVVDDTLEGLRLSGARTVLIVTGHYAQGHLIELARAALRAGTEEFCVLAAAPLEPLGDSALLDHAGHVETSGMLAAHPALVRLGDVREGSPRERGWFGEHPANATPALGEDLTRRALTAWAALDPAGFPARSEATLREYAGYVEKYGDHWDRAIRRWWRELAEGHIT